MMSILDRIVEDTRDLLRHRKGKTPASALKDMPLFSAPLRSFYQGIQEGPLSFITEIKKASPSKGVIREDFDPVWIAERYTANGSQAISVLTEPLHFQGSLDYLSLVRPHTNRPLLRKDFIFDEYQLLEARAYGADAVLLIAAILDPNQLHELHQCANELGLDCLVELYEESEIEKVDFEQVRILGVNNRDLRTFEVDLHHSVRIFEQCPDAVLRVSESGIYTVEDLQFLNEHAVHAVLIGESLMRAEDPGVKLKSFVSGVSAPKQSVHNTNQSA